jgi:phage N-6-adenine-methyltransferase
MNIDVHFSSKTDLWSTPQEFFDILNMEFKFQTDVCATKENAKCKKFFTIEDDGLSKEWTGIIWMNPPYGREISAWMEKADMSATNGATVVCLVPARTDTKWWHDYVMHHEIRFIKGRLKFGGHTNSAPFPSALVIMKNREEPAGHCTTFVV